MYTKYHSKDFANGLSLQRAIETIENLIVALSNAKVYLTTNQVAAALFAWNLGCRKSFLLGLILVGEVLFDC